MFDCRVELTGTESVLNAKRKRAVLRLTLVADQLRIEPDYFALETCLRTGGLRQTRVTNIGQRLGRGDSWLGSLDLPDLGPADFPLIIGGKLVLRGGWEHGTKAEHFSFQRFLYCILRSNFEHIVDPLYESCESTGIILLAKSKNCSIESFLKMKIKLFRRKVRSM